MPSSPRRVPCNLRGTILDKDLSRHLRCSIPELIRSILKLGRIYYKGSCLYISRADSFVPFSPVSTLFVDFGTNSDMGDIKEFTGATACVRPGQTGIPGHRPAFRTPSYIDQETF